MKSSTLAAATVSLLVTAAAASAANLGELWEEGALRVAVYRDFFPFSAQADGRMEGIDLEIGRAVAERLGLAFEVMELTADESVSDDLRNAVWKGHYLGGGTADLMMHVPVDRGLTAENDEVRILAPYYREEVVIAHNPSRISGLETLDALAGQRIGVELETLADSFLTGGHEGWLRDSVVHYRSTAEAVAALKAGEVAAAMGPRSVVEASLGNRVEDFAVVPFTIRMRGASVSGWDVGVAVKEDSAELAAAVGEAFAGLQKDGTIARIFREHGVTYVAPSHTDTQPQASAERE